MLAEMKRKIRINMNYLCVLLFILYVCTVLYNAESFIEILMYIQQRQMSLFVL